MKFHDKLDECCNAKLTCIILSSDTEQITHGSFGFHEKSDILAVCPPWINKSSGGPSSASSADCSSPILDKSQTCSLRSVPEEARIVSLWGDHWTYVLRKLLSLQRLKVSIHLLDKIRTLQCMKDVCYACTSQGM